LRKITSSETTFEKIYNQTKTTDWLPIPTYDPTFKKNLNSPSFSQRLTSISESVKSSKTNSPVKAQENGLININNGIVFTQEDAKSNLEVVTPIVDNQNGNESSASKSTTSAPESGIGVSSPNSAIQLSPGSRSLDQISSSSPCPSNGDHETNPDFNDQIPRSREFSANNSFSKSIKTCEENIINGTAAPT
jgi:hypothetical protein